MGEEMANVLITGAASGLGRATSRLMAAQGWTVAAADINGDLVVDNEDVVEFIALWSAGCE